MRHGVAEGIMSQFACCLSPGRREQTRPSSRSIFDHLQPKPGWSQVCTDIQNLIIYIFCLHVRMETCLTGAVMVFVQQAAVTGLRRRFPGARLSKIADEPFLQRLSTTAGT